MIDSELQFVVLPGLTLPAAAVLLALDLEARGCHFQLDGEDILVGPSDRLTDHDRVQIRRWKRHLRAIVAYDASVQVKRRIA